MKKIAHPSAVDGPVVSEGGRSPSTLSTGQAPSLPASAPAPVPAAKVGPLAPGQRWSVARQREVVLRLLRGEKVELLSRELGVPIFKLEQWRQKAGAARGLALRHDHGSNFMAEHVRKQARFWGISPSYAFVAEPETNGIIERLFRTLKEQAIHGRTFQTIDAIRDAVRDFAGRYNAEWLTEKGGYRSPLDARAARLDTTARRAASCNRVSRKQGAGQAVAPVSRGAALSRLRG